MNKPVVSIPVVKINFPAVKNIFSQQEIPISTRENDKPHGRNFFFHSRKSSRLSYPRFSVNHFMKEPQLNRLSIINRIFILLLFIPLICSAQKKNTRHISGEQLKPMNNVAIPSYIEIDNHKKGDTYKILLLGNSLAYHGEAPGIGWYRANGMAASEINKDYAHLLFHMVDSMMPDKRIRMRISGIASFERNFADYNLGLLDSLQAFYPDLLIIQIGENVGFDEVKTPVLFKEKYISLIRYFKRKNTVVICTTPFFPSLQKNNLISSVAGGTNSFLVDLSHLALLDKQNYAVNEENYPGDKSVWKADGIGIHPGDKGMKNIAKQIFITINAIINN